MTNHSQAPQTDAKSEPIQAADGFFQTFTSHPASVGETYPAHFVFAMRFAFRLFTAGSAAVVHAFIPAWCETTASREIQKLHTELSKRHSEPHQH